jgi:hypothetical protein
VLRVFYFSFGFLQCCDPLDERKESFVSKTGGVSVSSESM